MLTIKDRIKIFESVRDIPFKIGTKGKDSSCQTKTKLLGEMLLRSGINCRIGNCQFFWDSIVPSNILKLHKKPDVPVNHTFLEVFIPERQKWVKVDPTWDRNLKTRFEIAKWNGLDNTKLAVIPIEQPETSKKKVSELKFPEFQSDTFIRAFNKWLKKIRKKIAI